MDALFENKTAQFFEAANHIALYKEKMPDGWHSWLKSIFTETNVNAQKYEFCDVPGLVDCLGKKIPLDVHGYYAFADIEAMKELPGIKYGVAKFQLKSQAQRCKEGGRRVYDLACLNIVLLGTVGASLAFLHRGRTTWNWFNKHPIAAIMGTMAFTVVGGPIFRMGFNELGIGLFFAEQSHKKAIRGIECIDCWEDINEWTQAEAREIRAKKGNEGQPKPPPGMPSMGAGAPGGEDPLGLEKKQLKENAKAASMLEREVEHIKALIRRNKGQSRCEVHQGLRNDPEGYNHPEGWPIWESDRKIIKERMVWEKALQQVEAERLEGMTDEEKRSFLEKEGRLADKEMAKKGNVKFV